MNTHLVFLDIRRSVLAAGLAGLVPLSALAFDPTAEGPLRVVVCADYYVVGGERLADVDALEARAKRLGNHAMLFEVSGRASSTKLLDAVERFDYGRARTLEIRTPKDGGVQCPSQYLITDPLGRSMMP